MNKILKILCYILLIILLSPVLAIILYVAVGAALFFILYFYNRKKNGPTPPAKRNNYKLAASILFIIGMLILFVTNNLNLLSWQGYLWIQLITFVSFIPLCYEQYLIIKKNSNNQGAVKKPKF